MTVPSKILTRASSDELIREAALGNRHADDELVARFYDALRLIARNRVNQLAPISLDSGDLVQEVWLRFAGKAATDFNDDEHVLNSMALAMRHVILDYVEKRNTQKRGGGWKRLSIEALADHCVEAANGDLPELAEALDRLAKLRPRWALMVELSFFAGLTQQEIAEHLDVSTGTVKRDWRMARQWLQDALVGEEGCHEL